MKLFKNSKKKRNNAFCKKAFGFTAVGAIFFLFGALMQKRSDDETRDKLYEANRSRRDLAWLIHFKREEIENCDWLLQEEKDVIKEAEEIYKKEYGRN